MQRDFKLQPTMEPFVGKLLASFKRLYLNQLYSDITLTAFKHSFKLHRIVLISNTYFASLIDGPWSENGSDLLTLHFDDTNISLEALKCVIARMYGIDEDLNLKQNALSLLATGCFFDDTPLCIQCIEYIESNMSPTTVIPYLTFAEHNYYGTYSESILHACLTTLCKNASNASYLTSIANLPRGYLAAVLASDCLHVENEAMRFELVIQVMRLRGTIHSSSVDPSTALLTPANDESNKVFEKEQGGGHRRETSTSSTDTLIVQEHSLCVKESFPLDNTQEPSTEQEQEQPLHHQILSKSILYSNLPFTQLQKIRRDGSSSVPDSVLQKALWQQIELRSMVLCADTDVQDLGIQYDSQSDEEEANETDSSEYEATSPVGSFKPNMPMQDTETMEGGKGVFDLIRAGSLWNHVPCPPFRFGCTFDGGELEKKEVVGGGVGRDGSAGVKSYSGSHFYAGSMWKVYIQKLDGNEGPALGVYLQRTLPKETEKHASNVSHYIDKRIHARVWFQIICYFGNSQCCILESKPDLFKAEQSWGWRSTKMFKDVCAGSDSMLKCAVVIGQT